jgi:hypothetical protein
MFSTIFCLFLTNNQLKNINTLITQQQPPVEPVIRLKINKIMFDSFLPFSLNKAKIFKKSHYYKCKHISLEELQIYSSLGLYNAIENYRGIANSNERTNYCAYFMHYVNFYISGTLYAGMTKLQPLSLKYPRTMLTKKRQSGDKLESISLVGEDEWLFDQQTTDSDNEPYLLWEKIKRLDPQYQRILNYKYNENFEIMRDNKKIAELMGCSDETIRKKLKIILRQLL